MSRSNLAHGGISLGLLAALSACATATYIPTGSAAYPARAAHCELEIFSSTLPADEYQELGIVEAEGTVWKSDLEDVLPKMREEACHAGGEGLIINSTDTFAEGEDGYRVQRVTGTVIRWAR